VTEALLVAIVSPGAYGAAVGFAALAGAALVVAARRSPPGRASLSSRLVGAVLAADALSYVAALVARGSFSPRTSLPLALCNVAVLVSATACFVPHPLLVELAYFWGLTGALQAIITPDLSVGFPHLVFFQYVAGHLGIVVAALDLVLGLRVVPRRAAVVRVTAISAGYTAFVGLMDFLLGANYMFLRRPPSNWTLLRVLGPWPWYILGAAGVAIVCFMALDAPFWGRRRAGGRGRDWHDLPRRPRIDRDALPPDGSGVPRPARPSPGR